LPCARLLLLAAIPAVVFGAGAGYVGNQACARCHADIASRYNRTPMAMSSGRDPRPVAPGSFRHAASQVSYEIHSDGEVRISRGGVSDLRRLSYYIGSGANGRSFGYLLNGFLFEAPVTWYAQTGTWDVSPGYESDRGSTWSRPIEPSCLFCHASRTRWREGTVNAYADPAFDQGGIACERCHGPGSLHIEGKGKMVNPARLAPKLRDSICSQCHLTGQSRVVRAGRRLEDYRPGDPWSDFAAIFVPVSQDGFQANSHVEKLAESACMRAAGDRLWCGTCHDPHGVPASSERAAWFRSKCLTCHDTAQCSRGFDCTACHMPRTRASDAGHGVFTDHSIPRLPNVTRARDANSWNLRGFTAADAGGRELGLAYAEIGVRTGDRRQQAEAIRLLAAAPQDVEVQLRLADLQERASNPDRAVALYRSALRLDPNAVLAMVNLGRLYGSAGLLEQAIGLWQEALKRNPCQSEAAANLQIALRATKDIVAAESVRLGQRLCSFE
jgi:Tetratricopeptide repeat/Cytochrome c554 and c-prime